MIICGIDYSMISPAICIHVGNTWSFSNCKFHYFSSRKKSQISDQMFTCYEPLEFIFQAERFDNLASWVVSIIPSDAKIFLEGYSYASNGVVFHIGENTGVLKNKIWQKTRSEPPTFPPQTIKKFATGKGNVDKLKMHQAFVKETKFKIDKHFVLAPGKSPISDLVDSYFIAKLGFYTLENKSLVK